MTFEWWHVLILCVISFCGGWVGGKRFATYLIKQAAREVGRQYEFRKRQ